MHENVNLFPLHPANLPKGYAKNCSIAQLRPQGQVSLAKNLTRLVFLGASAPFWSLYRPGDMGNPAPLGHAIDCGFVSPAAKATRHQSIRSVKEHEWRRL